MHVLEVLGGSHVDLSDKTGGSAGNSVKCETLCRKISHMHTPQVFIGGSHNSHIKLSDKLGRSLFFLQGNVYCDTLNACLCHRSIKFALGFSDKPNMIYFA